MSDITLIKPSDRYVTHKIGSSDSPTNPIKADDLVIIESVDETLYPLPGDRLRVGRADDLVADVLSDLGGITVDVEVGGVLLNIVNGIVVGVTEELIPQIVLSGSLDTFEFEEGTPSASQYYSVKGLRLDGVITVTAPEGFELSVNNSNFYAVLTLAADFDNKVYVRLSGVYVDTEGGAYVANITHASFGVSSQIIEVRVSGFAPPAPLDYTVPEIIDTITDAGLLWRVGATNLTLAERKVLQDAALANYKDVPWAEEDNCTSSVIGRDVTDTYDIYGYVFAPKTYTRTALITGNLHGNEKLASAGVLLLMMELSNPDTTNPIVHIMRKYRLLIVPIVNPNGFVGGWRENAAPLAAGVNLNRNFDYNWRMTPSSQVPGTAPASEPETQAILDWVAEFDGKIDWVLDVHDWESVLDNGAIDDTLLYAPAFSYNCPYENMMLGYLNQLVRHYDSTDYYRITTKQRSRFGSEINGLMENLRVPGFNMENRSRTFINAPAGWGTDDERVTRVYEAWLNALKVLDYITPAPLSHTRSPYYSPFICPSLDSEEFGHPAMTYADMLALHLDASEAYTYNNGDDDISVKKIVRGSGTEKTLIVGVGKDYKDYLPVHRAITELDTYAESLEWFGDLLETATLTFIPTANPEGTTITDWAAGLSAEAVALRAHIVAAGYDNVIAVTPATHRVWDSTKIQINGDITTPAILTDPMIIVGAPAATELTAAGGATIYLNNWGWMGIYSNNQYDINSQYGDSNFGVLLKNHIGAILNTAASVSLESKYDGRVETPDIHYDGGTGIIITCATAAAAIHYTTDGSTPTAASATYSTPLTITAGQTIKALALKANYVDSAVASKDTTISQTETSAYTARVVAAGGVVVDATDIDQRITYLKAAGLYDNLLAEWSARYGIKTVVDTVEYVSALYSLIAGTPGNLRDALQATVGNMPKLSGGFGLWDYTAPATLGNDGLSCGTDFAITSAITLTAWIKVSPCTASTQCRIVNKEGDWGSLLEYTVGNRYLRWFGTSISNRLGELPQVPQGVWTHCAVVYDGEYIKGYLNGQEGNIILAQTGELTNTSGVPLVLGNRPDGTRGFYGNLDGASVYDVALTEQQILADYNNTKGRYGL